MLTATSILSRPTSSMLRMTFFSILTSCESFFARSGPKAPAACLRKTCPVGKEYVSPRFSEQLQMTLRYRTEKHKLRLSAFKQIARRVVFLWGRRFLAVTLDSH
jgi:hypothetical protein